jgi:hypothetical protein
MTTILRELRRRRTSEVGLGRYEKFFAVSPEAADANDRFVA